MAIGGIGGMDFGNRMSSISSGGIDQSRLREIHEQFKPTEVADTSETEGSFGSFLSKMVKDANSSQLEADKKSSEVAAGRNKDLHGAVLAMEKADVDFRMLTQVRNKVIEAYREIMRMQV
jgi:flagellar hook-basal body complex protein FliE